MFLQASLTSHIFSDFKFMTVPTTLKQSVVLQTYSSKQVLHTKRYINNFPLQSKLWLILYDVWVTVQDLSTVCHELLLTSSIVISTWVVMHSLIYWYLQCVTVNHLPMCMSFHKAIGRLVITRRDTLSVYLTTYIYMHIYFDTAWWWTSSPRREWKH